MLKNVLCRLLSSAQCRYFWWALALLMLSLEAGALYFQHIERYYPCELCIYVRVWVAALFVLSLVALWLKRWRAGRVLCALAGLSLSVGLALETWNLLKVEYGIGDGGACGFKANFPNWAPLDTWFPWMFEVQDMCQATPPVLFGITMAQGLVIVSAGLIAVFVLGVIGSFRK